MPDELASKVLPTLDETIAYFQRVRAAVAAVVEGGELAPAAVVADPATSYWLRGALAALEQRDPVDAVRDVEVLSRLAHQRLRQVLSESGRARG